MLYAHRLDGQLGDWYSRSFEGLSHRSSKKLKKIRFRVISNTSAIRITVGFTKKLTMLV